MYNRQEKGGGHYAARAKTEIVVRGKKIVISEWHARVYRAFFWTDVDEDDVGLYLWSWCHKLDMDDVINAYLDSNGSGYSYCYYCRVYS